MKISPTRHASRAAARLLLASMVAALAACGGVPNAGDNRSAGNGAGASRSGVEVFGTIDAGVSRTETRR